MAALAALALALVPSGGPTASEAGLRMWIPPGWHEVNRRLTPCSNPVERITIAGSEGGMVVLLESLDARRYVLRFPPRPATPRLRGKPQALTCCVPNARAGWFLRFRDRGRAFYAYVYGSSISARRYATQALDSLLVSPRRT